MPRRVTDLLAQAMVKMNVGLRRAIAPLQSPGFAVVWIGLAISAFGDRALELALVWLTIDLTGSSAALGTVLTAATIPSLVLLLIGGAWADRISPSTVMLWSDLLRAIVTLIFALLVHLDLMSISLVIAFAVIYGAVSSFFDPAMMALIPSLVSQRQYHAANALYEFAFRTSSLLGPALGGFLIARYSIPAALTFDAVTFAGTVAAMIYLRRRRFYGEAEKTSPDTSKSLDQPGLIGNLLTGLRFLRTAPGLLAIVVVSSLTNGLNNVEEVLVPVFVRTELELSAAQFGLIGTLYGAGTLTGAFLMGIWGDRFRRPSVAICGGKLAFGLAIALMGFAQSAAHLYVVYVIAGIVFMIPSVAATALWQQLVPSEVRGRVFSTIAMIAMAANPLGYLVAGWLGESVGFRQGLWLGGGSIVVVSMLALLLPQLRALDAQVALAHDAEPEGASVGSSARG